MLLDFVMDRGAESAMATRPAGAKRVSDHGAEPQLSIAAVADEVADRVRVPDRPPELTLAAYLEWEPKYIAQCLDDAMGSKLPASDQYLREIFKATNG